MDVEPSANSTEVIKVRKSILRRGIADSELTFKGFEYFLLTQFDFDRQLNMDKICVTTGFSEERTTRQAW